MVNFSLAIIFKNTIVDYAEIVLQSTVKWVAF